MKHLISFITFASISPLQSMEGEPHPMLRAVLQAELQLVWMRRDVHGDHGQIGQKKRNIFQTGTKNLYSLKKLVAESWDVTSKQSAFFELSKLARKNATDAMQDSPDMFNTLDSFNLHDFERVPGDPIESVISFIAENRRLKPKPWWAKKATLKAWRTTYQKQFLKSLPKPQRREIKSLESNIATYAACFLYQLRKQKLEILATIQEGT